MRAQVVRNGRTGVVVASLAMLGCQGLAEEGKAAEGQQAPRAAAAKLQVGSAVTAAFPTAQMDTSAGGVTRLYGAALATGASAVDASDSFRTAYASAVGLAQTELTPASAPQTGVQAGAPGGSGVGLMADPSTGQPKFWLYRYTQNKGGVPVYGAGLKTLVRNQANNPVVWAASSVRSLGDFTPPATAATRTPDPDKSLRAIPQVLGIDGKPLPAPTAIGKLSDPALVVFAGTEDQVQAPRMAIEYKAETLPHGKWHFVADATTGDVLHVDNMLSYANVTGKVTGIRVQGDVAAECAGTVEQALGSAEVMTGYPGEQAYTDASGNYSLSTSATSGMYVQSLMGGRYFHVNDNAYWTDQLYTYATPPATVNFVHNSGRPEEPPLAVAQVNAYVNGNEIRSFALKYVPTFPEVGSELYFPLNVNLASGSGYCPGNAWYDSWTNSIQFCQGSPDYTNTAFASVAHHEYTHRLIQAATPYAQAEYGEGMADTLAALFAGQHGLGYGFFLNQCSTPLRDAQNTCQYLPSPNCSTCGSDIHTCGQLLSGTVWDIRSALAVTHPSNYADIINNLAVSSILLHAGAGIGPQLAVDFLTLDDDDGNPGNGTPHRTEICAGFAKHGMPCPALPSNGPCATLCSSPTEFSMAPYGSYNSGNLGTGAVCFETTSPIAGGNCGNFASPRTLSVNGVTETCNNQNWSSVPAKRNGGYCIQTTAGNYPWAYFAVWRGAQ